MLMDRIRAASLSGARAEERYLVVPPRPLVCALMLLIRSMT